jgi:hypothetical protein
VVATPALDRDLRHTQRVERFCVEQFVAQARVEALDEAVFPGVARRDGGGLGTGTAVLSEQAREHGAGALRLFLGDLQPLASPDPLDPLVIDEPAGPAQQRGDLAIAVATILAGQLDDVGRQPLFVVTAPRDFALRRAMLPERRAGAALGDRQLASNMLDAGAATRGA